MLHFSTAIFNSCTSSADQQGSPQLPYPHQSSVTVSPLNSPLHVSCCVLLVVLVCCVLLAVFTFTRDSPKNSISARLVQKSVCWHFMETLSKTAQADPCTSCMSGGSTSCKNETRWVCAFGQHHGRGLDWGKACQGKLLGKKGT